MRVTRRSPGISLVDAHVHIYDCFILPDALDVASSNFRRILAQSAELSPFRGILLLSETSNEHVFERLWAYAARRKVVKTTDHEEWRFSHCLGADPAVISTRSTGEILIIVAGRQIVTRERLEILALITQKTYRDGTSIHDLMPQIIEDNGIPVIPWGVGKWLGSRGKLLSSLIQNEPRFNFFLGDNSGRPFFWKNPVHFAQAAALNIKILPGSDPLPLPPESRRLGSFGFAVRRSISIERPGAQLKRIITKPNVVIHPYGQLERPYRFIQNQLLLRLH